MKPFSQFQCGHIYCIFAFVEKYHKDVLLDCESGKILLRLKQLSVVDSFEHSVELLSMFAICMSHLASWGIALHCLLTVLREHMCSCLEGQSHGNTQRSPSFSFVWKAGTAHKTIAFSSKISGMKITDEVNALNDVTLFIRSLRSSN